MSTRDRDVLFLDGDYAGEIHPIPFPHDSIMVAPRIPRVSHEFYGIDVANTVIPPPVKYWISYMVIFGRELWLASTSPFPDDDDAWDLLMSSKAERIARKV